MKHIHLFLSFVLIFSTNLVIARGPVPTFGNTGEITICVNGSYFLNPSTTSGIFSSNDPLVATVNAIGYVTGVKLGTAIVSLVTLEGTVSATINVVASSGLSITDPLAQSSYKFNNNPQGPIAGINNYIGYNGYSYSSQARPSNTGFFRASNQLGDAAGCPYEYYIFRCTTCGTVPEYASRPQGTLTGSTILSGSTGQLTYTSSNSPAGGPFTIVYLPTGGSNVTVNNISSTVAFNVASETPLSTTSYKLISVTDEITKATTDFSGSSATINILGIGVSFEGGIIAYILQPGDPGYDVNTPHGIIAAASDQSAGIRWYNGTLTNTLATGTALGTGLANTNTIISIQGATASSYAAGLARAYSDGIYHDWYLPSKDELNKLYINRSAIGGFTNFFYWSSSQLGYDLRPDLAWFHSFGDGLQNGGYKWDEFHVRAIRAF